jgi:serine/threonine protein kinase/formylglycine-generating enzyme required for sulfatase activity
VLCFRCGSYNVEDAPACSVCGQKFEPKQEAPRQKATTGRNVLYGRGDVIAGRYTVKDLVGQGGVGAVYKVHDKEVDVDVALKVISPNLLQTEEERKLFSRQMRQARKLHHPNIIRIYDEGHDDQKRFITMKLLDGLTLRKVIRLRHDKGQPFLVDEVIPIIHQIAAALDYAHKTTWHGDLKPENVIILPDLLKITDFNLVKSLPLKPFLGIAKTRSTGFFYIAPELRLESTRIDGRCDIFSLGVILCEMLTGVVYEGHFSRPLTSALEELPARVDGLIRRALSEHPDGRYKKAVELAKDLEAGLSTIASDGLPIPAKAREAPAQERSGRRPPPPPMETSPGLVPDITDEEEAVEPSLEELGPSQVVMLPSGVHDRAKERPEDIPHVPPPVGEAGTSTEAASGQAALQAEGIIETLYRDDDVGGLVPPPLPDDAEASDSYSHQRNPALAEDTEGDSETRTEPQRISQDSGEEETKPDLDTVGIHEELTALKRHPAPALMDDERGSEEETATVARPTNATKEELEQASERSSPRRHRAEGLPPPVVSPTRSPSGSYVPPSMRPVSPPPRRRKSAAGLWITVITLLSVAAILGGLMIHKISGNGDRDPKPTPVVDTTPDAGAPVAVVPDPVVVDAGARVVETPAPVDQPDPTPSGLTDEERRKKALELAKKNASEFAAQTRAEEDRQRALEERIAARKREEALKSAASDEARQKLLDEQRREADEAARAAAERARADAAMRKLAEEEAARKKAEAEAARLAAMPKDLQCPKGMAKIAAGSFQFGAKASDDMRNYGELSARSVELPEYCIDYYEYPNSKSRVPIGSTSWSGAQAYCKRKGKRLCTEQEWEKACKGPGNKRFPYGNGYNPERCNTQDENGNDRELSAAKDFKRCRSGYVVFSMSGNVEEWTSDSFKPGTSSKAVKGGAVNRPDFASRCAARRGVSPGTRQSTLGFRCCADPK